MSAPRSKARATLVPPLARPAEKFVLQRAEAVGPFFLPFYRYRGAKIHLYSKAGLNGLPVFHR
jgi:hypothetical protein